jgi:hypothetical protein
MRAFPEAAITSGTNAGRAAGHNHPADSTHTTRELRKVASLVAARSTLHSQWAIIDDTRAQRAIISIAVEPSRVSNAVKEDRHALSAIKVNELLAIAD